MAVEGHAVYGETDPPGHKTKRGSTPSQDYGFAILSRSGPKYACGILILITVANRERPEAFLVSVLKVKHFRCVISWLLVVLVKFKFSRFSCIFKVL